MIQAVFCVQYQAKIPNEQGVPDFLVAKCSSRVDI
jgi:hypothetical protein